MLNSQYLIEIAKQEIECQGNDLIESYGNPNARNFDGIHLRGKQAVPYMTRSFIKMLTDLYPHLKILGCLNLQKLPLMPQIQLLQV